MKEYIRPDTSFSIPMSSEIAQYINPPHGMKKLMFMTICHDVAMAMKKDRDQVIRIAANGKLTCKEVGRILDEHEE